MTVGERIKKRRIELGLTQEELAKRMGYKGKTSVCVAETKGDNVTTTKVEKFAKALDVSAKYLMGWEDTDDNTTVIRDLYAHIDPEIIEKAEHDPQLMEFIQLFLNTSEENRPAVLQILKGLQPRT